MPPRVRLSPLALAGLDGSVLPAQAAIQFTRGFSSTTPCEKMSRARQQMFEWLRLRKGAAFAHPPRGGPNYLGPFTDQPFPLNPLFRSQPVLDDQTKELIWEKVTRRGEALKAVSAEMGVDVRRVAAVVRLKETEKNWIAEGKKLAIPYATAVMKMLPTTSYQEGSSNSPHEPINEVHVHSLTMPQLFVPVSESRRFTREDAAVAFHEKMLSADARSPQPELIDMEREIAEGSTRSKSLARFKSLAQDQEDAVAQRIMKLQQREEQKTTRVKSDRYEFRFKEINVDDVGRDGRSRNGTGWRYGAPHTDRKRGTVKIPTSVP